MGLRALVSLRSGSWHGGTMSKSFYSLLHFNHPSYLLEGFLTHILRQQRLLTESQWVRSQIRKIAFTQRHRCPSWISLHFSETSDDQVQTVRSLGGFVGRRTLFTCLSEFKRIAKGWPWAENDLQNVCLVNTGLKKIFHWKPKVRVEDPERCVTRACQQWRAGHTIRSPVSCC